MTAAPVHLAEPGARRTLCGLGDRKGPTTPYRSTDAPPRLPGAETICTACAAVRFPAVPT